MKSLLIKSSLYDYSVEFCECFATQVKSFEGRLAFVIDKRVYELYKKEMDGIDGDKLFLMDADEEKKNMDTVLEIINFWQSIGVRKDWKVICIGGGITQDVTTIAANLYLRNIEWYFFPTTLLAMSDSCIGGKCGINLGEVKNQIGVFYPPKKIFIWTKFLETLTKADITNGWGEILKFSLTEDESFFERLSQEKDFYPCERVEDYIYEGLKVKQHIIEQDEFEGDLRRVLNYGHTFGHALEAYTHHAIPHGTAVIWGIDVVNYIACKEGLLDEGTYRSVRKFIETQFLPQKIRVDKPERIIEFVSRDKKIRNGLMYLAVLRRIGKLEIYPMSINPKLANLFAEYLLEN